MKKTIFLVIMASLILVNSCTYKAGNRITLDYPIETDINFNIIRRYMDSMILKQGYNIPPKWYSYNKLIDLPGVDAERIYFKKNPEEMYLIQFNGILDLADVYNEEIVNHDWVSDRQNMPKEQAARVIHRFKVEVLGKIEEMAKKDKVPDSILYFHRKW